jgi:hypothetical protein
MWAAELARMASRTVMVGAGVCGFSLIPTLFRRERGKQALL